ncbi:MAG: hypothetical protein B6242_15805 [Anaerolineaceae bacterium 4572_78]|nr:MAG: hypothetical protein B6242_15805 [Anaerolineaceae bacterium 4572_78]
MEIKESYSSRENHERKHFRLSPPQFVREFTLPDDFRLNYITIYLEGSDISFKGGLQKFILNRYNDFCNVHLIMKKEFTRGFYVKPDYKMPAKLQAEPTCELHQLREVGSWFDVLLKWYLVLNKKVNFDSNKMRQFLEKFKQSPYHLRYRLDSSAFDGTYQQYQQLKKMFNNCDYRMPEAVPSRGFKRTLARFVSYHEDMDPANLYEGKYENEWVALNLIRNAKIGVGFKKGSHIFTPEMADDLLNLFALVDINELTYENLFLYRFHLLGNTIDFLLDETLIDVKVTVSSTSSVTG